ncbi:heterokaryon incompatibility protein-domain-containing protein [Immersiella caudata]|uniref:Heterokaryon incompatibility protein-domain-containing protein n=1 Tax=Immersiella caudata TaxID=314043 RepID=A0AA39TLE8_9PEZI|nr:heterokaryon incompatibility protein-domain-containing protein [Immersiella caudata]
MPFTVAFHDAAVTGRPCVKVWEERPLSPFTYVQLHWGGTAVGGRLLVHRGEPSITTSKAIKQAKTSSSEHFEQAKEWMSKYKDSHKICRGPGNAFPYHPARIVEIIGGDGWQPGRAPSVIRVVNTSDMDEAPLRDRYLASSHCWGPRSDMRFKLLASNLACCCNHIDFSSLSRNVQDAITVTLALGYSYIWIDSLCIIQYDPPNSSDTSWKTDWDAEAPKMGSVYSNAACTIASTGFDTSAGGCFHGREMSTLLPIKIGVSSSDALLPYFIYIRRDDIAEFTRGVDLAPLNTRGWVMQERLLSRRLLHFGADIMFWECCGRAASELNSQGYTYKCAVDFKDIYASDLSGYAENQGATRESELDGERLSWGGEGYITRRPPPAMIDPDAPRGSEEAGQLKRGFWRNVLKENPAGWDTDEKHDGEERLMGLRTAFERLRREGAFSKGKEVGRDSFSQVWYDVVESYSRMKLTKPRDKLMALKGIEDEAARATKFTYLKGVWQNSLVTDLLWFAIEGPGKRLFDDQGVPVAPTWSWASIEGVVALDLLPENAKEDIQDQKMLARIDHVSPADDDLAQMKISLCTPMLAVNLVRDAGAGNCWVQIERQAKPAARAFLDVELPEGSGTKDLVCASFLVLKRAKKWAKFKSSSEDVQGLVLRRVRADVYERVGYFTTSYMAASRAAKKGRRAMKKADERDIYLTGWAGLT